MNKRLHKVSGIYASREEAEATLNQLLEHDLQRERLEIIEPHDPAADVETTAGSDSVLKDVLVNTAIGTVIGAGAGALGMAIITAANVSLFVASPLLGTLTMMGWGAGVGGMAGAAVGAGNKERKFSALVKDATRNGSFVLVAHTASTEETTVAEDIISHSVQGKSEIPSADAATGSSSSIVGNDPARP